MTRKQRSELVTYEGRKVCLALADGSRLDDCELVSAGRGTSDNLWLFAAGTDTFVPVNEVAEVWEALPCGVHGAS